MAVCAACDSEQEIATSKFCSKCGAEIPAVDSLRSAFKTAFYVHATLFVLTALMLDGGRSHQFCLIAMIGYWLAVLLLFMRRRKAPTRSDFLFIRYSVVPLWIAAPYIAEIVYRYIGESTRPGIERFF